MNDSHGLGQLIFGVALAGQGLLIKIVMLIEGKVKRQEEGRRCISHFNDFVKLVFR